MSDYPAAAKPLADLQPQCSFFVGIDSDGCAFDSMEIKHKECFCPNIIKWWDLLCVSKYAREAAEFVRKLRAIVRYIGVCDGNMEQGSLRCDANVSVRPSGQKEFGTKTEIKNMNSFKYVENREKMHGHSRNPIGVTSNSLC